MIHAPGVLPYVDGESTYYLSINRNKRSIALDLRTPEGGAAGRELAARADVVVENFLAGRLAKYALDYDSVRRTNPDVIYCSVSGFGSRTRRIAARVRLHRPGCRRAHVDNRAGGRAGDQGGGGARRRADGAARLHRNSGRSRGPAIHGARTEGGSEPPFESDLLADQPGFRIRQHRSRAACDGQPAPQRRSLPNAAYGGRLARGGGRQ